MFRFLYLAVILALVSRCHGVDDPKVDLRGNDHSKAINQTGTAPKPPQEPFSRRVSRESKKLVCYTRQTAYDREGVNKFTAEDVDPFLCTHIIVGSAAMDVSNNSFRFPDRENLRSLVERKQLNPHLKIMLSIGGPREPASTFPTMFGDKKKRAEFIQNVAKFLNETSLDGIEFDWRYTAKRSPADRNNYTLAVKEFREESDKIANQTKLPRYLLSITLPVLEDHIDKGFDLPAMSPYVDLMVVLAYSYHDLNGPRVYHQAPLYHQPKQNEYNYENELNGNHTVSYLIEKGADVRKLALVIPMQGVTHVLKNSNDTAPGAPAAGPGKEGDVTKQAGYLAYNELCQRIKDSGWTVVDNDRSVTGAYAFNGSEWISYDSVLSARLKARFANEKGLGSLAFGPIDMDDYNATCQNRTYYPLINSAKEEFLFGESVTISPRQACAVRSQNANDKYVNPPNKVEPKNKPSTVLGQVPSRLGAVNATTNLASPPPPKLFVCFLALSATDRSGIGKFAGADVDPFLCSHIIASSVNVRVSLNAIIPNYRVIQYTEPLHAKKRYNPNLKIMLSVGDPRMTTDSFADVFNDRIRRAKFIQNIVTFLSEYSFDGVEIDWRSAAERTQTDRDNFTLALKEFREEFDRIAKRTRRPRYVLSIRIPTKDESIDKGFDLPAISPYVDFMTAMTFFYDESYKQVNHLAPLYYQQDANEYQYDKKLTVNHTISHLIEKGVDTRKLTLGVPVFAQTFTLANFSDTGLGARARGRGELSGITRAAGNSPYSEICRNINDGGWTVVDNKTNSSGPYAYSGYEWVAYENMNSARLKGAFANEKGLGGLSFYLLDLDDFDGVCHNKTRFPIINAAKEEFLFGKSVKMRPALPASGDTSSRLECSPPGQNAKERAVSSTKIHANRASPPTTTVYPMIRSDLGPIPPKKPITKSYPVNLDLKNLNKGKSGNGKNTSHKVAASDKGSSKNQTAQKTLSQRGEIHFFHPHTINIYL